MKCPHCESERVQRCELAYEQGIYQIDAITGGITTGGIDGAKTRGTTQSAFSKRIAPPKKKKIIFPVICCLILSQAAVGYALKNYELLQIFASWICLILVIVWAYKQNKWNKTEWLRQMQLWQKKYVCLTCGQIYEE